MKKAVFLFIFVLMVASFCASCEAPDPASVFRVAIVQQLDHASLDEIRAAIEGELDTIAAEKGITIEVRCFNGQNDAAVLGQIGARILAGDYDLIIPIATLAAQYMVNASQGAIPVVYAAVSDPEAAGLTGFDYVTGVSDALDTGFLLEMMRAIDPDIRIVGLLYSNSEPNSALAIAQAKLWLEERGIAWIEKTGTTAEEIIAAAASLSGRVDAVFTPTDNTVMAAQAAVSQLLNSDGIPHYAGADSFAAAGAFAACGVDYSALGAETARLAAEVLLTGQVPEYRVMEGGIITVNTSTARALGLDYSPFFQMAGTVREFS